MEVLFSLGFGLDNIEVSNQKVLFNVVYRSQSERLDDHIQFPVIIDDLR